MKKIICILIFLGLFCVAPICEGGWIYEGDAIPYERTPPQAWKFENGTTTGNFRDMPQAKKNAAGWFPVDDISPSYDSDIQTAGVWIFEKVGDRYEKNRVIFDKETSVVRMWKKGVVIAEGKALLRVKHGSDDWSVDYKTDRQILMDYFNNTIVPLVPGISSQQLKDLNDGDEYTWPNL